jgi:phosphoribosylaminoimidazole-succinocarboxamide synthase
LSDLVLEIPGWKHVYSGKVRDLYESTDPAKSHLILIVASDRISAFDNILQPEIAGKGENLTAVSNFWFDLLPMPNHRASEPVPAEVAGRATVAKKLEMFPVECVVRGYLSGSAYKEYLETGSVCGIALPEGLEPGDKLPEAIFTPAYKAQLGEHDENISFDQVVELVGLENANRLRELSLQIFAIASDLAARAKLILADTKFEFGTDPQSGEIVLGDEVLTPDSSRYWDAETYEAGVRDASFDKQIVRNWLLQRWDQTGVPPVLAPDVVERTASAYAELRQRLLAAKQ